jgi:hypothetical protein
VVILADRPCKEEILQHVDSCKKSRVSPCLPFAVLCSHAREFQNVVHFYETLDSGSRHKTIKAPDDSLLCPLCFHLYTLL